MDAIERAASTSHRAAASRADAPPANATARQAGRGRVGRVIGVAGAETLVTNPRLSSR
jgi:hypothetical protein